MRGIVYRSFGEPSKVLEYSESIEPARIEHPNDVLVRVSHASINPADYKQMSGDTRALMHRPLPIKPGFDFSGVVVEKGAAVSDRIAVGAEVCGMIRGLRTGSTCELLAVNEEVVSVKPPNVPHQFAGGVPLAALTAFQCLRKAGLPYPPATSGPKMDPSVFVTGGPGGVGTFVIQIAKRMFGAKRIVTTASGGSKAELCKRLGADHCVDYRTSKFWEELAKERFDACIDCTGEAKKMLALCKDGGGLMSITACPTQSCLIEWVNNMGPTPGINIHSPVKLVLTRAPAWVVEVATGAHWLKRNGRGVVFDHVITNSNHAELDEILKVVAAGKIEVIVDKVYPLKEGVDAYLRSASGKAVGKVIVRVEP